MSLSPEMTRYITTGRCPYCDVEILSTAYAFQNKESLQTAAYELASWHAAGIPMSAPILAPSDVRAKVEVVRGTVRHGRHPQLDPYMQCLTCTMTWKPSPSVSMDDFRRRMSGSEDWTRSSKKPPSDLMKEFSRQLRDSEDWTRIKQRADALQPKTPAPGPRFTPSPPPRQVDLSRCRLLDVTEEKRVEKFLREERKPYRNNSSATVTRKIAITSSIATTVTTEETKLKSHGEGAGIALVGFASIQGQIQHQLSERYAVALQSTFSVSEETSASIPPYSTIIHIIQWKMVTWVGTALLGNPARLSEPVAEMPYEVPLNLTYDDDFINAHDVPGKKKKSS